jgi:hypothetical protein
MLRMAFLSARRARPVHRARFIAASVLGASLFFAPPVTAQPDASTSLLLKVPRLADLVVAGDVSALLTLTVDATGESAYDTGYIESAGDATQLVVSANAAWDLSARLGTNWSCPGSYNKDEDDLFIKVTGIEDGTIQNGASAFTNLSGSDLIVAAKESASLANQITVQTKVLLDWTKDVPGSYSITVAYTLVTHLP